MEISSSAPPFFKVFLTLSQTLYNAKLGIHSSLFKVLLTVSRENCTMQNLEPAPPFLEVLYNTKIGNLNVSLFLPNMQ